MSLPSPHPSKARKKLTQVSDLPLVILRWEDAQKDMEFDGALSAAEGSTILLEDVGWLVRKTTKKVVLASCRALSDNTVRWLMTVPRGLVRDIIELAPKELPRANE